MPHNDKNTTPLTKDMTPALSALHGQIRRLIDGDAAWQEERGTQFDMYIGGKRSFDEKDLQKLKADKQPILSINIIKPVIDTIYGIEKTNRKGFKVIGVDDADDPVAAVMTGLSSYEDRNGKLSKEAAKVFKDGVICGRGWMDMDTERGPDFLRNNKPKRELAANVFPDSDGDPFDQNDWACMARQKWYALTYFKSLFPKTAKKWGDELEANLDWTQPGAPMPTKTTDHSEVGGDWGYGDSGITGKDAEVRSGKKRVRVTEVWNRKYETIYYATRGEGVVRLGDAKKQAEEALSNLNEQFKDAGDDIAKYVLRDRKEPRVYKDIFSGNVHPVKDKVNDVLQGVFPLVKFTAYAELDSDGKWVERGLVFSMIDPQREKNKRRMQQLSILNRAPKSGGFYKDTKKNKEVIANMAVDGGWHPTSDPEHFKPFDDSFIGVLGNVGELEDRAALDVEATSGINKSMLGISAGSKESGVLARQRITQGTLGVVEIFEHFDAFRVEMMKQILNNIRAYWTAEKILRAAGMDSLPEDDPRRQVAKSLATGASGLIAGTGPLEFDVRLDEGEGSPSARAANFQTMLEAIQFGIPIPPSALVKASTWPNKEEILAALAQAPQEPAPDNKGPSQGATP